MDGVEPQESARRAWLSVGEVVVAHVVALRDAAILDDRAAVRRA